VILSPLLVAPPFAPAAPGLTPVATRRRLPLEAARAPLPPLSAAGAVRLRLEGKA
jgi:hypothetical protein